MPTASTTLPPALPRELPLERYARDARILVDGGYRIERVTPIDQFVFSAQVEAVAVLRR